MANNGRVDSPPESPRSWRSWLQLDVATGWDLQGNKCPWQNTHGWLSNHDRSRFIQSLPCVISINPLSFLFWIVICTCSFCRVEGGAKVITFELFGENNYQNIFFFKKSYDFFALYLLTIFFKQEYFPSSFNKVALCSFVQPIPRQNWGKDDHPIKIAKLSQINSFFIYHICRAFSNQKALSLV